jgi:mannose-6-phosphate isomerase-like protein (cupin superfamily)
MRPESIATRNLDDLFARFDQTWSPRVAGEINDMHLKLAKLEGEFVWHAHEAEDELFLVHRGTLRIELRDRAPIVLEPGEFAIIPRGVEHKPVAETPCEVLLLEPRTTVNTGDAGGERTVTTLELL